jgi:hypothetical protein
MATFNNASTTMDTSAESPSQEPSASQHLQQQPQKQKGIDIQQALSILSERSNPETSADDHNTSGGCGCCHGAPAPEHAKAMGQTIDLLADNSNSTKMMVVEEGKETMSSLSKEEQEQEEQRLQEERSKERLAQIQNELNGMSDKELLQAILKAQQDRVATYRDYERYETTHQWFFRLRLFGFVTALHWLHFSDAYLLLLLRIELNLIPCSHFLYFVMIFTLSLHSTFYYYYYYYYFTVA